MLPLISLPEARWLLF
jgi:hypothetical protein